MKRLAIATIVIPLLMAATPKPYPSPDPKAVAIKELQQRLYAAYAQLGYDQDRINELASNSVEAREMAVLVQREPKDRLEVSAAKKDLTDLEKAPAKQGKK